MTYKCATCNEEFKDGELVAVSSKGEKYHFVITDYIERKASKDCTKGSTIMNQIDTFNSRLYFKCRNQYA